MDKRLTRSDYVFILVFIFMLILILTAFFIGMKVGTDRTTFKYADLVQQRIDEREALDSAYHQSYLVSFYHTAYLPFREFHLKWTSSIEEIENGDGADASSLLRGLSSLANDKYDYMVTQTPVSTSPLLVEAHTNYLKSLRLFSQASDSLQSRANTLQTSALIDEINQDAYFTEAKNYALTAQKEYFEAIVLWHQTVNNSAQGTVVYRGKESQLSFDEWSRLSLNLKNAYVAERFLSNQQFSNVTPQDVALRVDEVIINGQAETLNAVNVPQVIELLLSTYAVRQGDFVQSKARYYNDEELPLLPFFSKME